jgi:type I restriction enzyme S subunit
MVGNQHTILGELFKNRREPGRPDLPLMSVTMNDGLVDRDSLDRKTDSALTSEGHLLVRAGDIAYNMMRMWQGASGMAEHDAIVSPAYIVLTPTPDVDPLFASYWFKSTRIIYLFWAYSYGITGDRLRLYYKDFARIPVSIPPKSNQTLIGKTLATWDSEIETVRRMIAAKRRLKQGLAQLLVTGRRRISGFHEAWTRYEFGAVASPSSKRCAPAMAKKGVRCIELEHISQGDGRLIGTVDPCEQRSMKAVFSEGDVLFGKLRPNLRKSYLCDFSGLCSTEIWVLQPNTAVCCSEFLAQLVQSHRFIAAACVTAGSKMPRAEWSYVSEIPFELPPLPEQRKIAAVLGTVDRDVTLLEKKVVLLVEQKKGLMQEMFDRGTKVTR